MKTSREKVLILDPIYKSNFEKPSSSKFTLFGELNSITCDEEEKINLGNHLSVKKYRSR